MKLSRTIAAFVAIFGLCFVAIAPVFAASSGSVQGYEADGPIDIGTIVELASGDNNKVKASSQDNPQNMFGVVVDRNQLPLAVSDPTIKNETYVAVSGTFNVLVSTQGGDIKKGDYITLSSLNGIGMNAGHSNLTVLGRAAGSFDGKGVVLGESTLKDTSGNNSKTVKIGTIPLSINIQRNPDVKSTKVDVPAWLERMGQQIADKTVSPVRIYLSLAITAVTLITALIVLYAGVRNGIISIGRNPMSKKSIFRALLEVILTSVLIVIIGLFAVYLLLKL